LQASAIGASMKSLQKPFGSLCFQDTNTKSIYIAPNAQFYILMVKSMKGKDKPTITEVKLAVMELFNSPTWAYMDLTMEDVERLNQIRNKALKLIIQIEHKNKE